MRKIAVVMGAAALSLPAQAMSSPETVGDKPVVQVQRAAGGVQGASETRIAGAKKAGGWGGTTSQEGKFAPQREGKFAPQREGKFAPSGMSGTGETKSKEQVPAKKVSAPKSSW